MLDAPTIAAFASLLTAASVLLATWRAGRSAKKAEVKVDLLAIKADERSEKRDVEASEQSDKLDVIHDLTNSNLDEVKTALKELREDNAVLKNRLGLDPEADVHAEPTQEPSEKKPPLPELGL